MKRGVKISPQIQNVYSKIHDVNQMLFSKRTGPQAVTQSLFIYSYFGNHCNKLYYAVSKPTVIIKKLVKGREKLLHKGNLRITSGT